MKKFKISRDPDSYHKHWPPEAYVAYQQNVKRHQLEGLKKLMKHGASESQMDKYLRKNPEVMACLLIQFHDGHHASWIVPQQDIRPPQPEVIPGLKPDYILGGKSSDGLMWYVVELKAPNDNIFSISNSNIRLSSSANRGIIQLLEYIDYCAEAQGYLRDTLHLIRFREPTGILLIGNEAEVETNDRKQRLKAALNRNSSKIQIHTYDALVRAVEQRVKTHDRDR